MRNRIESNRWLRRWLCLGISGALAVGFLSFSAVEARADHSLSYPCIQCHSLRSSGVVVGSRNVKEERVKDPLYGYVGGWTGGDWYCDSTNGWNWGDNARAQPLDCSFCHDSVIGAEFSTANGGKFNPGASEGSSHPVDVLGDLMRYDSDPQRSARIICNNCHAGSLSAGNPDLLPQDECTKAVSPLYKAITTDGYPNHIDIVETGTVPGFNDLTSNPPRLSSNYASAPWSDRSGDMPVEGSNGMLCYICHDADNSTSPPQKLSTFDETGFKNIWLEYNVVDGGHNVPGTGNFGNDRVACFFCHDPHASVDVTNHINYNEALILNLSHIGKPFPYSTMTNSLATNSPSGYTVGGADRDLCMACHGGSGTVDGTSVVAVSDLPNEATYGFHANAHDDVTSSGNCLQPAGGCHPSVHNTSPHDCLACHSTNALGTTYPDKLAAVSHIDSEFGMVDPDIGDIGGVTDNGIRSQHNIVYNPRSDAADSADLSDPLYNSCLGCHSVPGSVTDGTKVGLSDGALFGRPASWSNREDLDDYNGLCLGCHDDSNQSGRQESFVHASVTLHPPQVGDYYFKGGHGTGFTLTGFNNGSLPSGHNDPKVPCLECHLYHGSTAYKLLPGNVQTTDFSSGGLASGAVDQGGRVVKGYSYKPASTTGTEFTIGGVSDSTYIDYVDYTRDTNNNRFSTDDRRMWKFSDYDNANRWNSYYESTNNSPLPTDPSGTEVSFGTSGDTFFYNDEYLNICTEDVTNLGASDKIGFCDACHLYSDATDGTTDTYKVARTHEVLFYGGSNDPQNKSLDCDADPLDNPDITTDMSKDCSECHDPHGSGDQTADNQSAAMVRGKVITGYGTTPTSWDTYNVVYEGGSGTDSGNEDDGGDNADDLCAVCHTTTIYARRDGTGAAHNEGGDCTACHQHGIKAPGFFPSAACNGCHGYPPMAPGAGGGTVPPEENYAGGGSFHDLHVGILENLTGESRTNFPHLALCGPCHGQFAGDFAYYHDGAQSGGAWTDVARTQVDIGVRGATMDSWGADKSYDGRLIPNDGTTIKASAVPDPSESMDATNSVCVAQDCHGVTTASPVAELNWFSGQASGALADRTVICEGCHDETEALVRAWDLTTPTPAVTATNLAIGAATHYFGTLSGYGQGGHGDADINPTDDPQFIESASGSLPVACTACHDDSSAHFPAGSNLHRLTITTIENANHDANGLCNSCHPGSNYPGAQSNGDPLRHHPSYAYWKGGSQQPVEPNATQPIMSPVTDSTSWDPIGGGRYAQSEYGAGSAADGFTFSGNPDRAVDWWDTANHAMPPDLAGRTQTPPPKPVFYTEDGTSGLIAPKATMPLERYIYDSGTSDLVMCVTCHNPHGTDLLVYDEFGNGQQINDNNMLRLRDEDNTLCDACH